MRELIDLIRERRSARVPFDPERRVRRRDLERILEAARWAPTAHNMQNFEIVAVDDAALLRAIGAIRSLPSETFLRENYAQLAFSEAELRQRKTGVLAAMFPPAWRRPDAKPEDLPDAEHRSIGGAMQDCPLLLIVLYDPRLRAPASEGDALGMMSLGCVMQNMWLMAEAVGIGFQILSALGQATVEGEVRRILGLPAHLKIAYSVRLGYPQRPPGEYLRVRREIDDFTHLNAYGAPLGAEKPAGPSSGSAAPLDAGQ